MRASVSFQQYREEAYGYIGLSQVQWISTVWISPKCWKVILDVYFEFLFYPSEKSKVVESFWYDKPHSTNFLAWVRRCRNFCVLLLLSSFSTALISYTSWLNLVLFSEVVCYIILAFLFSWIFFFIRFSVGFSIEFLITEGAVCQVGCFMIIVKFITVPIFPQKSSVRSQKKENFVFRVFN